MGERFSAFSFVDRITVLEPGRRAVGHYTVPPGAGRFPPSLMAEAVGQLAAWAAMSQVGFTRRPVAGLAAETLYSGAVKPGETLDLDVGIESCDQEMIAYGGTASVDGLRVIELKYCVGPMLPIEEFDAPEAVRADFETLRGPGAPAGRFSGVAAPEVEILDRVAGESLRAVLHVPSAAPFFGDHFPRRPVLPGTLLLDCLSELALAVARESPPLASATNLAPVRVTDVKIRSFTPPGQVLELRVELLSATSSGAALKLTARADGRGIATARIEVEPRTAAA